MVKHAMAVEFTGVLILVRLNLGPNLGLRNYCSKTLLVFVPPTVKTEARPKPKHFSTPRTHVCKGEVPSSRAPRLPLGFCLSHCSALGAFQIPLPEAHHLALQQAEEVKLSAAVKSSVSKACQQQSVQRRRRWDCKEGRKGKSNLSPFRSTELFHQLNSLSEVRLTSQYLPMLHTSCLQDRCIMHNLSGITAEILMHRADETRQTKSNREKKKKG